MSKLRAQVGQLTSRNASDADIHRGTLPHLASADAKWSSVPRGMRQLNFRQISVVLDKMHTPNTEILNFKTFLTEALVGASARAGGGAWEWRALRTRLCDI